MTVGLITSDTTPTCEGVHTCANRSATTSLCYLYIGIITYPRLLSLNQINCPWATAHEHAHYLVVLDSKAFAFYGFNIPSRHHVSARDNALQAPGDSRSLKRESVSHWTRERRRHVVVYNKWIKHYY